MKPTNRTIQTPPSPDLHASPWRDEKSPPAWIFPAPVRPGRFLAAKPDHAALNVEVALDHIPAYHFAGVTASDVLHYDLQTQLLGNARGRLGSGRSGVYRGYYLKGVGRTPAAANWNDNTDLYHGSGHLAPGSAIRERAITICLQQHGLGNAIVPCTAVLLGRLTANEKKAVQQAHSSSRPGFTAADAHLMALSAKPANFARMSNIAFALDRFDATPLRMGELFLDLEHYLHSPEARASLPGSPQSIANALELAFFRGLENFQAFARAGLFWLYLESNFSLDGRFLDLETPIYYGQPFVGVVLNKPEDGIQRELLGFEEFGFAGHWRGFLAWLRAKLDLLCLRECGCGTEVRAFLREVSRAISRRFTATHMLFDDKALLNHAATNLAAALGLDRTDNKHLRALARHAFAWRVYNHDTPLPSIKWCPVRRPPAAATSRPRFMEHAPFSPGGISAEGHAYAKIVDQLGKETSLPKLLRHLDAPLNLCSRT